MIDIDEALRIAMPKNRDDLVPVSAQWIGIGWVVRHETRRYLESRSIFDRAIGGGSLVLNDGRLREYSSREYWQVAVVKLASDLGLSNQLESWVVEQADALVER